MNRGTKKVVAVLLAFLLNYLLTGFLDEAGGVKGFTTWLRSGFGSLSSVLPSPLGFLCFWTPSEGCFPIPLLPFYLVGALFCALGLAVVVAWIIKLFTEDSDEEQKNRRLEEKIDALLKAIEEEKKKANPEPDSP